MWDEIRQWIDTLTDVASVVIAAVVAHSALKQAREKKNKPKE